VKQPSLLIVDDEVNVLRTLQLIFERDGYRVTSAHSCAEALALFSTGHPKLDGIITDLNMEREDIGFDVVRAARKLLPVPIVIVCTGYANPDNSRTALELRVDYLALKPVDIDELRGAVARLLAQRASDVKGRKKASL
jgi:CheY-like chemotaxis protein